MIKKIILILTAMILMISITGCTNSNQTNKKPKTINVFAAMSLKDALTEIIEEFNNTNPDIKIVPNFASSGTLKKQIAGNAPADLYLSANTKHVDELDDKGLILSETQVDLFSNALILIVSKEKTGEIYRVEDLINSKYRLSIGTPEIVPAGQYAKESLINLGFWDKLEKQIIFAKDVRQVLTYVETGNVDAGIVYSSDQAFLKKATMVMKIPSIFHSPIIYRGAIIKSAPNIHEAKTFMEFLQSSRAQEIFQKYGFQPPIRTGN